MGRTRFGRWLDELKAAPSERDAEEAIARLRVREVVADAELVGIVGGKGVAGERVIAIESEIASESESGHGHGHVKSVGELGDEEAGIVRVGRGVYPGVPTREGRVRLLRAARYAATGFVVVHVPIADDGSHLARALVDAPRMALRKVGLGVAEAGDRFGPERYAHCFFDEEALLDEVEQAGLAVVRRRGFEFVLVSVERAPSAATEETDAFSIELTRVLGAVRAVDTARRTETPDRVLATMRARGAKATARGPIGRARLRRAIGWVDALARASCYRRVLLEIALDAGAARETVVFGLDVGRTGHIAFEDREERTFDVSFAIPPDPGPGSSQP